ncbi:hypothetical protein PIB30_052093 [Stylosanthes scabra]|uniref:Retrotransposon gag domain-containing protein n=1 Tax=Stylosanthes scabra TaxID=79078 RepID=A0ABU6QHP2_9FABA|nr:hypothetical protein [Stylosanthes scabra]
MQFRLGGLSLDEYVRKFEDLCRFSQICKGDPASFKSWKCMKFEAGLKDEIQLQVSSAGTRNFTELVEQCQRVDECCKRMAVARNARSNMPPRNFGRRLAPQGRNFKGRNKPFRNFSQGGGSQNRPNAGGNGGYRFDRTLFGDGLAVLAAFRTNGGYRGKYLRRKIYDFIDKLELVAKGDEI